ncbi:hypothetical protein C7H62_2265 [Mesoflavibacter sp. HG96]|uniref:DUF6048 family protein n=1 Tax=Mesoflavibacter profundi TaxID=2708110 RepID=A0ABT4RY09_9FLAO|nr:MULTISPECIES: DUF6048 family protein [Mesoflavibacter]MDA0176436.1 DUF6048 family protein [Mesoflavibacter profundi]QIJ90073.1 hypothetical protein C7H62_2265 [Mesoflavibacter sp. HG96]QIJ92801.1 hypothetical protein C7H56_2265 [Mesoflavibacter sp. HG37]
MKLLRITFFLINTLCIVGYANAQDTLQNTAKPKLKYGLRLGADAGKLIRSFLDDDYKGFEIVGDYRLTKEWYIAGELGTEEKITTNDYLSVTASGSYFKAGADYNMYDNWIGMENMIYAGFRVGASTFSQTRNNYTVYNTNQYWSPQNSSTESIKFSGLSAIWVELQIGIKAEVLNNLFVGINAQLKSMISQDQPENLENLYVPGFNKTYDSNSIGVGYGYTVSYMIPLFKKSNTKKEKKEKEELPENTNN